MFNILNAIFQIKEIEAPAGSENLKRFAKISIPAGLAWRLDEESNQQGCQMVFCMPNR